jgi:imidazoleglycerol-phosphate dehydratase
MLDQFNSHAQIGTTLTITDFAGEDVKDVTSLNVTDAAVKAINAHDPNRHAGHQQAKLMSLVGAKLGTEFKRLLAESPNAGETSRFCCPLDEALVACTLKRNKAASSVTLYTLPPFGKFPAAGRQYLGKMETAQLRVFWSSLAQHAGLDISLRKIRGDNAHHIVESSFKAVSRAFRNMLDGIDTTTATATTNTTTTTAPEETTTDANRRRMYGPDSINWQQGVAQGRQATVSRRTKETSIAATVQLDGGAAGVQICTGIATLDDFLTHMATAACISLNVACTGDLWIDEHHTAEDVAISVGQVLNEAFGTKAGLNRMWCAAAEQGDSLVEVTMDLSNRPCLTHNLHLDNGEEKVGDLSMEMLEHVLESLVVNSRMTVHMVQLHPNNNVKDTVHAVAMAFGQALKYCAMVDSRRMGATASSKGTLSV